MAGLYQSIVNFNIDTPIIEFIGFNGAYITAIITVTRLIVRYKFLVAYIFFYYANDLINQILKIVFKYVFFYHTNERITQILKFASNPVKNPFGYWTGEELNIQPSKQHQTTNEKYGFQSGHTQSIFFSLTFLYLVTNSNFLLLITASIATLALYQRLLSRKHTVEQLLTNSVIGSLIGYLSYRITKHFIETNKTPIL